MTDIVERLRMPTAYGDDQRREAADEIERLREELADVRADAALLRAALDRAADALEFYDNKAEAQKARRTLEPKPFNTKES